MGEIAYKLWNALGGFWDSLSDDERRMLAYLAAYVLVSAFVSAQQRSRERLKAELREELHRGTGS